MGKQSRAEFKYFQRFLLGAAFLAIFLIAAGCSKQTESGSSKTEGKIQITTTIGMITDIVKEVGGGHVEVSGLMKSGVDPHLYKASQGDIKKLDQADIIFYNGLHLEGKMVDILENMSKKKPTYAVSDYIDKSVLRSGDQTDTEYDPHIWFNVQHWMKAVEKVRDELAKYDEKNKADYETRAAAYLNKLKELDDYTRTQIASIPKESRVLVTAHDAFGYFGDAYDIEVKGLQGISTASEYGSKDVSELRDFLVERGIKAVFIESSVPKKAIEAVIQGAKEKGHDLKIGGELYSDAMGKEGTEEGTYIGMVRANVDTIVNALK
ncbi:zinc ABC transporter substrate-binding protein [Paenibacillus larvae]|uniref:Manganese-binding lipoprotein MntA n=3 Tax=Paenibacillus larvae TaxID=1464 RepID=A0A2L1TQZ0_9BACL|nr:zinc ABC transporter substrate-binding protein [Paenibacillus larvae]AQR76154.1 manganese transporter [Paenibacillus larvae subsp. larvae]AQT86171.1 manganese transporter [Paenibacillus larvae subsp. pulvifaciens]AQZ47789.1 manganese transporter [Paenibacillus larvae subsp. pulvifaciens]AVF23086.1 manganese-binding lipoprotein MntA [Paenibacillus larvae subsp. larvae]AVF25672.1 manganese-binding lipoprotein MntA [Paenibacillus larvae subsp. larvae]